MAGVVAFLLFVALLLLVAIWYLPLIQENKQIRKDVFRLEAIIQKEEEQGRQLQAAIKLGRSDPRTVERVARERYRLARPGETIILFEPATNSAEIR